jgi:uncharacterized protein
MAITYDPAKRECTLRERELDFEQADTVFAGLTIDIPDLRRDCELRINSIGYLDAARRRPPHHFNEEGQCKRTSALRQGSCRRLRPKN